MKPLILSIILSIIATSCNSPPKVTVTTAEGDVIEVEGAARVGGRGAIAVQQGGTKVAVVDNNDDSFREFNKTARTGAGVYGAINIADTAATAYTAVTNTKEATKIAQGAEITKRAKIAADAEAAAIAAKEAEAATNAVPVTTLPVTPVAQ